MPYWEKGEVVAGVDEAGRGPLAGPVVAAAVVLDPRSPVYGLDDSKALTPNKRQRLLNEIEQKSLSFAVGIIEPDEIDRINILNATLKAMEIAVSALEITPGMVFIDGNRPIPSDIEQQTIVKGDKKCRSIAAASIVAKVTRDIIMAEFHAKYPVYNFQKHKGYPTKEHYEAIKKHGTCPIHRLSYKGVTNY